MCMQFPFFCLPGAPHNHTHNRARARQARNSDAPFHDRAHFIDSLFCVLATLFSHMFRQPWIARPSARYPSCRRKNKTIKQLNN